MRYDIMEGSIRSSSKKAPIDELGLPPISKEGIDALKTAVEQAKILLTKPEREKMLKEIEEDPELFNPLGKFGNAKTDVSVRIPAWIYHYLERRKRITGMSVSKQIAIIVTGFVAGEMREILEGRKDHE
jgi:hypothetical protein